MMDGMAIKAHNTEYVLTQLCTPINELTCAVQRTSHKNLG